MSTLAHKGHAGGRGKKCVCVYTRVCVMGHCLPSLSVLVTGGFSSREGETSFPVYASGQGTQGVGLSQNATGHLGASLKRVCVPGASGLTRSLVQDDKVWLWPPPGLVLWWDITHLGGWLLTLRIEHHWGEDLPIR